MIKKSLSMLSIRTGVVHKSDVGFILACDPEMEANEIPHTNVFTWKAGRFEEGSLNFNAHTCCIAKIPELAWVMLAGYGEYGITTRKKKYAGNIFDKQNNEARRGMIRKITEIDGKAYAAGLGGTVYRLDKLVEWTPMYKGLPNGISIEAIDGFDSRDIYAAGDAGAIFHFDGSKWFNCDSPTNINFNAVKCADDGYIYLAGNDGCLLCGREDKWDLLAEDETHETFWDIELYENELYISTISFVYSLKKGRLVLVDFGEDTPATCYQLSAANGVMWSIGARDVMMYNGEEWTRII